MDNNDILDFNLGGEDDKVKIELSTNNRLTIFFILSLGLYGPWWMYKQWVFFREEERLDIWPAARAIFAIFFIYSLFEKIQFFAKTAGYNKTYNSGLLFLGFIILTLLSRLPDPAWLISLFSFLFYLQPNDAFNYAIENSEDYKGVYTSKLSTRQIILVILGGLFWLLIIIGLFFPEGNY